MVSVWARWCATPKHQIIQAFKGAFLDGYFQAIPLIQLNVVCAALCIPVFTIPPALAGLTYATSRLYRDGSAAPRRLLRGFGPYLWASWRWAIVALGGYALLALNLPFYQNWDGPLAAGLSGVTVAAALWWSMLQLHALPLLIEQREPSLRLALRNAVVLSTRSTFRSVRLLTAALLLSVATSILMPPAWLLITASVIAYLANRETLRAVSALQAQAVAQADRA